MEHTRSVRLDLDELCGLLAELIAPRRTVNVSARSAALYADIQAARQRAAVDYVPVAVAAKLEHGKPDTIRHQWRRRARDGYRDERTGMLIVELRTPMCHARDEASARMSTSDGR